MPEQIEQSEPLVCSACFRDQGLRLDAENIGEKSDTLCPHCGTTTGAKLSKAALERLAHRFFVWGSLHKVDYGAAPIIQFNDKQKTSINVSPWLKADVEIFEKTLGIGFFHYGPRLWMVGEVEPLKALQKADTRAAIINRILKEYPTFDLKSEETFYRVRKSPIPPTDHKQYDSPPDALVGTGRLDTVAHPVLYASPDLEVCVHELRMTAEDELFVATMSPTNSLRLLNLGVLLREDQSVTEFESLDMAVHMLFLAGRHSYEITRAIAQAAEAAGFDGLIYPSYFSLLRLGIMPFQTVYGISFRRIPQLQPHEEARIIQNLALFGRPVTDGRVTIKCINKLITRRIAYEFHFGPVEN